MENGKYSVAKVLAKAKSELVANQIAVGTMKESAELFKKTVEQLQKLFSDKEVAKKFAADLKEASKAVLVATGIIPEGFEVTMSPSSTLTLKRLHVSDYTAEFSRIIAHLEAMSVEEIEWSRDIEWVLGDFTQTNSATTNESVKL